MIAYRLLCVLFVIFENGDAKLKIRNLYSSFENHNDIQEPKRIRLSSLSSRTPLILVFDFVNIFSDPILRRASRSEIEDVDDMFESMLERLNNHIKRGKPLPVACNPQVNHKDIMNKYENDRNVKKEIMKLINKFSLNSLYDPDTYLSESDISGPSLVLYFKLPFTILVIRSGRRQWHYMINPPSPLPCWFYEANIGSKHNGTEKTIKIPTSVSENMYLALLPMLTAYLNYPV